MTRITFKIGITVRSKHLMLFLHKEGTAAHFSSTELKPADIQDLVLTSLRCLKVYFAKPRLSVTVKWVELKS